MLNESGAVSGTRTDMRNGMRQCHFSHHKLYMIWTGSNPGLRSGKSATNLLNHSMAHDYIVSTYYVYTTYRKQTTYVPSTGVHLYEQAGQVSTLLLTGNELKQTYATMPRSHSRGQWVLEWTLSQRSVRTRYVTFQEKYYNRFICKIETLRYSYFLNDKHNELNNSHPCNWTQKFNSIDIKPHGLCHNSGRPPTAAAGVRAQVRSC
jgi:hypothetical protein